MKEKCTDRDLTGVGGNGVRTQVLTRSKDKVIAILSLRLLRYTGGVFILSYALGGRIQ